MALKPVAWPRWLLFFLLLLTLPAQARSEVHAPFYQAVRGNQVVYVLGTLHVSRPDDYPLRPAIESAFKASATLFLELDLNKPGLSEQLAASMVCSTPCLQEALDASEWASLRQRLGNNEAALAQIAMLRPWAAAMVLSLGDFLAIGMQPGQGVEHYLLGLAGKSKPIEALETPEVQLRSFTGMSPAEQKELLVQWLGMDLNERLSLASELAKRWQAGDADALYAWYRETGKRLSTDPARDEAYNRKFILERNHRFVTTLLARIGNAKGPYFLAVGALHLGGPEGVLKLLQQRGYTITAK